MFYELMDFTFELSKLYAVLPFEIFKQDKDNVMMCLNYMVEKSETVSEKKTVKKEKGKTVERVKVNSKTATGNWW